MDVFQSNGDKADGSVINRLETHAACKLQG
jgi:hypothetical protein